MKDIIERLCCPTWVVSPGTPRALHIENTLAAMQEAADEIEMLREGKACDASLRIELEQEIEQLRTMEDVRLIEIERLRTALQSTLQAYLCTEYYEPAIVEIARRALEDKP